MKYKQKINYTIMDLTKTIEAKSDQLNAIDLIGGAKTIKITKVIEGKTSEQPVIIHYEGDNGRPWKPSLGMRRILIQLWGGDGDVYENRMLSVYREESVKWAGEEVGGIWISHASHITEAQRFLVTVSRNKRRPITIEPLIVTPKKQMKDVDACRKAIEAGTVTIETIEATYDLTEEQRTILTAE